MEATTPHRITKTLSHESRIFSRCDEFVLLLPGTSAEDARLVAQGFCDAVKRCGFHSRGQSVEVSLSIGIAQLREGDTGEILFERADAAMYDVKNNGRDGCAIAQ